MKCYYVYPKQSERYEGYVFAETRGKARQYALESLHEEGWQQIDFIDVYACREPVFDKYFIEEGTIFSYDQIVTGGR